MAWGSVHAHCEQIHRMGIGCTFYATILERRWNKPDRAIHKDDAFWAMLLFLWDSNSVVFAACTHPWDGSNSSQNIWTVESIGTVSFIGSLAVLHIIQLLNNSCRWRTCLLAVRWARIAVGFWILKPNSLHLVMVLSAFAHQSKSTEGIVCMFFSCLTSALDKNVSVRTGKV